jgi:secondary thiamine-phosphate synthase enzyme
MQNTLKKVLIETKKQFEIVDITDHVKKIVTDSGMKNGLVLIYCQHTTAAIRINNNEPLLIQDFMKMLYRLIPVDTNYSHDLFEVRQNVDPNERSNGHAHVKAFLLGSSETLAVENSKLIMGKKQSIFFVELDGGRSREIQVKILGE